MVSPTTAKPTRSALWIVALLALCGMVCALLLSLVVPKKFESVARVNVLNPPASMLDEAALITSATVADRVVDELGIRADVTAEPLGDQQIITITATASSPEEAAAAANTTAAVYRNVQIGGAVQIIQGATVPDVPVAPTTSIYLLVGTLAGAAVGLAAAGTLSVGRNRLVTPSPNEPASVPLGTTESLPPPPSVGPIESTPNAAREAAAERAALRADPTRRGANCEPNVVTHSTDDTAPAESSLENGDPGSTSDQFGPFDKAIGDPNPLVSRRLPDTEATVRSSPEGAESGPDSDAIATDQNVQRVDRVAPPEFLQQGDEASTKLGASKTTSIDDVVEDQTPYEHSGLGGSEPTRSDPAISDPGSSDPDSSEASRADAESIDDPADSPVDPDEAVDAEELERAHQKQLLRMERDRALEVRSLEAELAAVRKELRSTVIKLKDRSGTDETRVGDLQAQLGAAEAETTRLREQLEAEREEHGARLSEERLNADRSLDNARRRFQAELRKYDERQRSALAANRSELDGELAELRARHTADLDAQHKKYEQKLAAEREHQTAQREAALARYERELEELAQQDQAELSRQADQHKETIATLRRENDDAAAEIDELRTSFTRLRRELANTRKQGHTQQGEQERALQTARDELALARSDIVSEKERNAALRSDLLRVRADANAKIDQILEERGKRLREMEKSIEDQRSITEQRISAALAESEERAREASTREAELNLTIARLQRQLDDPQARLL